MILLLGFAFLSGLVTILTPCIWPLLPIILSSSVSDKNTSHRKPLGITLGLMLSFAVFTLAISTLIRLFHFDPNSLRFLAVVVIGFLGITMVIPALSRFTEVLISRLSGLWTRRGNGEDSGFAHGFITGLSLGIVWSPCAGPILAAIATLAATGKVTLDVVFVTIAYVLGVGIPLFVFSYFGGQIFTKTKFISKHTLLISRIFGVVMILTALAIYTNYDKIIQTKILGNISFFDKINSFEKSANVQKQLDTLKGGPPRSSDESTSGLFNANIAAPDFIGATAWLNPQKALTLADLKGKVVLVDFWTYTCINCIRTLPHVTSWYDKYKDSGFVVIGVHTPEFEFEKSTKNVLEAIDRYNIHYPVAQDNNFAIWHAFNNSYWPAEYLIDAKGVVRRTHFGEGEYDETEKAIQMLLTEAGKPVSSSLLDMPDQTPKSRISPETYLGSKRMEYYYPNGNTGNGKFVFKLADNLPIDSFSFGGEWTIDDENAKTNANSILNYNFRANKVFLVLRPPSTGGAALVKVFIDGVLVDSSNAGSDVVDSDVKIHSDRLYNLVDLKGKTGNHILKLEFQTPQTELFAFTFG